MMELRQDSLAVHGVSTFSTGIVIDLGCVGWVRGNQMEDSISTLAKRFRPHIIFGFDPHPGLKEAVGKAFGTTVLTSRSAAWLYDGMIGLELQGNCTHVENGLVAEQQVPCFDLARWILGLPAVEIVLKMDVEGAEYVLLPHLIEHGAMERISRLLVEWHTGEYAHGLETDREAILAGIDCIVEEWQ
jgi:hypothetical protein